MFYVARTFTNFNPTIVDKFDTIEKALAYLAAMKIAKPDTNFVVLTEVVSPF